MDNGVVFAGGRGYRGLKGNTKNKIKITFFKKHKKEKNAK